MIVPALVPAAGRGERMGGPKLLLPLDGGTLIGAVLDALHAGGARPILVVTPPLDRPDVPAIVSEVDRVGGMAVHPDEPTPGMRESVVLGLAALEAVEPDFAAILLTPADCPGLTPALVARLIDRIGADPSRIVIPARDGRRGHPLALPRRFCDRIAGLPPGTGINGLIRAHPEAVDLLPIDDDGPLIDLDTPDEYRSWLARG